MSSWQILYKFNQNTPNRIFSMEIHFSYYSTPLWFAFIQAWIYAILLWVRSKQTGRLSDMLLGLVLVGMAFNIWEYMLGFSGIEILWKQLNFFPRGFGYAFPPICYYYFKSQVDSNFRFTKKDIWNFLPFIIHTLYHIIVFSFGQGAVKIVDKNFHGPFYIPQIEIILDVILDVYFFYRSLKLYRQYQKWTISQFSDVDAVSFKWFRNLLIILALTFVSVYAMIIIDSIYNLDFKQDWWDKLIQGILIYYVCKNKILHLMQEEKLYLQPELSLADISGRLRTNVSVLSGVVNNAFGKNFNDFVNEYRVKEFQERILLPENKNITLLGIAFDCGFNSKATFNRSFKKFTGKAPKEFLEV